MAMTQRRSLAAALATLVVAWAGALGAQVGQIGTGGVAGTVRDSLGTPVAGALISVAGTDLVVETDESGEFRLAKARAGEMSLRVRRIGFQPDTARITVVAGSTVPVEFVLARLAVELTPLVVYGRRNVTGPIGGFYDRLSRGMGHFFTREQIERRNPMTMTDLFRMIPGARVESRGLGGNSVRFRNARCAPLVWLDGTPTYAGEFPLDALDPRSFEGVEIYSGPASVPAEFQGNRYMSSACGTVILWSRQGEFRARKPKKGEMSPAAMIEQLVAQQTVFTAAEVDTPARPDSSDLIQPVYPDSMFDFAVAGRAVAEFVVNLQGEVVMETFSVVTTTHPAFGDAVRRAVKDQRYFPAKRKGASVQQVVQQPFDFVPDSTALRRRRR
jgi:hypothetical protein